MTLEDVSANMTMLGRAPTTLKLVAVLLLLIMLELRVGTGSGQVRHGRRHHVETDWSSCPHRCICRPADEVPCDWCAQTAADDGQDGRVSCEGCGYSPGEQVCWKSSSSSSSLSSFSVADVPMPMLIALFGEDAEGVVSKLGVINPYRDAENSVRLSHMIETWQCLL